MDITSYVAIGDSFTEGLDDPYPDGTFRGWADRVAEQLAQPMTPPAPAAGSHPGARFRYANLAVRGRLLRQVVDEQLPRALEHRPDLVTFVAGGNDLLRPGADPDALAKVFQDAVRQLRTAGCQVMLFTGVDPRDAPVIRHRRGLVATYYLHIRSIADRFGCHLVDQWSMQSLRDWRAWSTDRLHLSAEGHRRVAARVCDILRLPGGQDWQRPWTPADPRQVRGNDLRWAREHLLPWIGRRLRGRSSGDAVHPKRPDLLPFPDPAS